MITNIITVQDDIADSTNEDYLSCRVGIRWGFTAQVITNYIITLLSFSSVWSVSQVLEGSTQRKGSSKEKRSRQKNKEPGIRPGSRQQSKDPNKGPKSGKKSKEPNSAKRSRQQSKEPTKGKRRKEKSRGPTKKKTRKQLFQGVN